MIAPKDELTALLTLTKIEGIGPAQAKVLYEQTGSALEIFRSYRNLSDIIPGVTQRLIEALDDSGSLFAAERELQFIRDHRIRCLTFEDDAYPVRLRECSDAPLVLFTLGNVNPNPIHSIAIVGTRKATIYGRQLTERLVRDLSVKCPDTLIISGLAFGIDVSAHKSAMENNLPTVGVLAHGLDKVYPAAHRNIARQMLSNGGLLTEFMSGTTPFKPNFIQRNRIVAGMADAVVVVESGSKGGSLITARLAEDYCRSCFAYPGEVGRDTSAGCNELIRNNRAGLIQSADDLIKDMGWSDAKPPKPIQRELFPDLTPGQQKVMERLGKDIKGVQLNTLVVDCNIPVSEMLSILLDLEMKGLVHSHPGNLYTC